MNRLNLLQAGAAALVSAVCLLYFSRAIHAQDLGTRMISAVDKADVQKIVFPSVADGEEALPTSLMGPDARWREAGQVLGKVVFFGDRAYIPELRAVGHVTGSTSDRSGRIISATIAGKGWDTRLAVVESPVPGLFAIVRAIAVHTSYGNFDLGHFRKSVGDRYDRMQKAGKDIVFAAVDRNDTALGVAGKGQMQMFGEQLSLPIQGKAIIGSLWAEVGDVSPVDNRVTLHWHAAFIRQTKFCFDDPAPNVPRRFVKNGRYRMNFHTDPQRTLPAGGLSFFEDGKVFVPQLWDRGEVKKVVVDAGERLSFADIEGAGWMARAVAMETPVRGTGAIGTRIVVDTMRDGFDLDHFKKSYGGDISWMKKVGSTFVFAAVSRYDANVETRGRGGRFTFAKAAEFSVQGTTITADVTAIVGEFSDSDRKLSVEWLAQVTKDHVVALKLPGESVMSDWR